MGLENVSDQSEEILDTERMRLSVINQVQSAESGSRRAINELNLANLRKLGPQGLLSDALQGQSVVQMSQIFTPTICPETKTTTLANPLHGRIRNSQDENLIILEDQIPKESGSLGENIESSNFYNNTESNIEILEVEEPMTSEKKKRSQSSDFHNPKNPDVSVQNSGSKDHEDDGLHPAVQIPFNWI